MALPLSEQIKRQRMPQTEQSGTLAARIINLGGQVLQASNTLTGNADSNSFPEGSVNNSVDDSAKTPNLIATSFLPTFGAIAVVGILAVGGVVVARRLLNG